MFFKKLSCLVASFLFLTLLFSCSSPNTMKLSIKELTEDEETLLQLLGIKNSSKIFEFSIGPEIKSVEIKSYLLVNGEWQEHGGSHGNVQAQSGRLALALAKEPYSLRIALQYEESLKEYSTNFEEFNEGSASATSWENDRVIEPDTEIPLLIHVTTDATELRTYDMELFGEEERLAGYKSAIAVTVSFLSTPVS